MKIEVLEDALHVCEIEFLNQDVNHYVLCQPSHTLFTGYFHNLWKSRFSDVFTSDIPSFSFNVMSGLSGPLISPANSSERTRLRRGVGLNFAQFFPVRPFGRRSDFPVGSIKGWI